MAIEVFQTYDGKPFSADSRALAQLLVRYNERGWILRWGCFMTAHIGRDLLIREIGAKFEKNSTSKQLETIYATYIG